MLFREPRCVSAWRKKRKGTCFCKNVIYRVVCTRQLNIPTLGLRFRKGKESAKTFFIEGGLVTSYVAFHPCDLMFPFAFVLGAGG